MAISKLIFLILFLLPPISALQNITLSSSLVANVDNTPSCTSPSGDFAFGFKKLDDTNLFLLAIWFDKIPDKTIIWHANGDNPAKQGSELELAANGLVLTDPEGHLIWKAQVNQTVSYGAMLDTGNFVLVGNDSVYLWESFNNSTDTVLPSQTLESGTGLFSRLGETNYSTGRFKPYFLAGDIPSNPCSDGSSETSIGICGYNSICAFANGRPNCTCLPEYSFIDQNNTFGGCKSNFPLGCGAADASENLEELYEVRERQGVNFPFGDYEKLENYSKEACKDNCLRDCLCAAAIYGSPNCWKKKTPLANGKLDYSISVALIKIRKGAPLSNPDHTCVKNKTQDKAILVGSLSASLVLNALFLITVSLILFLKLRKKSNPVLQLSTLLDTNLHMFSYKELEEATDNFKEQIGRGSSAIVYRGTLKVGSNHVIAVKKLDKLTQEADKEFKTEMKVIGKTCHKNLVRLLGFCEEGSHRLLVYEFMTTGTLTNFLLGIPKPGWNIRAQIVLEVARGLVYLHEECEVPIIHCDIKPENILLDEDFRAKISDFGLSKLLLSNQSRTMTAIRGTRGYVAPEWFRTVAITAKVDVYSFGVVLLEIICCRKNVSKLEDEKVGILTEWIFDCLQDEILDAVFEFDEELVADEDRVNSWIRTAIWCIQEDPSERPSMKMVLQMLEGFVAVPPPPKYSFSSIF